MYTVRDRNERKHTYRVESNAGDTKVVHLNLVLDISFLSVVTTNNKLRDDDSEGEMSASEDSQSLGLNQSSQAAPELGDEKQFVHEQSYCSSSDLSKENDLANLVVEAGSDPLLMSDVQSGPHNTLLSPADEDCTTGIQSEPVKPVHRCSCSIRT